ncbi:MAG TPA: flagellar biosynthetic protein FliR [Gemmataceae bacterium]|nr:flagellar biosynthetic protein FliR [Gemmataceae bacterium]
MQNLILFYSLILTRVGAFVTVLPLFGGVNVPRLVKAGLAFALATVWIGNVAEGPPHNLLNRAVETSCFAYGVAVAREFTLGALLGYGFSLFQVPARVCGEFLTQELGLSFGAFLDPTGTANLSALTQILDALGILLFLGLDGHHLFLAALDMTFARYPVGGALPNVPIQHLVAGASLTVQWGLVIAMPVAVALFVVTFVLSLMTRAAPQINLFTVGFPLRLLAGLLLLFLLIPNLLNSLVNALGRFGELLTRLI